MTQDFITPPKNFEDIQILFAYYFTLLLQIALTIPPLSQ